MYHYAGLVGILLGALVAGVRSEASFVMPPPGGPAYNYQDNPEYKVGKTINVEWTSDLSSMDLVIWQQYPAAIGQGFVRLVDHTTRLSIDWEVSLEGFSTNVSKGEQVILYMGMYETGDTNLSATSHYFNVSVPEDVTTTTAATTSATATGTGTSTSDASATTTGSETTSASSEPTSDDSGLSTGAVAGIGVGSAVVGIAALAGLGFFFWKRHRRGAAGGQYTQSQQSPPPDEIKTHELASSGWNHAPPQRPVTGPVTGPTGLYEAP
ncbi:hypothetical protein EDB81DRAFT_810201 [Dactylonectria macrodidyma]|uniref:Uncharacterized protein n=1 Tax=Dactylonectria macrodidyma TaxID=307937 RepID=A0A9P9INV8_9HYPO|nr:hypothetical protein EDB81DRAFT_810201 [Dactylonectria macrodidyma]